ncbi:MAG: AAA family ATPase [Ignavibacteria bacterium]|nr:AAA family ATPase [Ignavibacteria bacterium]
MRISLDHNYKALTPFDIELPNFTIITGLNGSGKTQLLFGLYDGNNMDSFIDVQENSVKLFPKRYVQLNSLIPKKSPLITQRTLDEESTKVFNTYQNYKNAKQRRPDTTWDNYQQSHVNIIEKISISSGKDIENLILEDFHDYYPLDDNLHGKDLFQENFSKLIVRYFNKKEENEFRMFRKQHRGENIQFLSDDEFFAHNGEPPWLIINKILNESKLDFRVEPPKVKNADYDLKLINTITGSEVQFTELSSGEKVLMSLVFILYNSNLDVEYPKLLLMDEPDGPLHPSMAKQFLDVIQNVFVKDKGVKVIITTHSPSTVALAPEESLFVMNKFKPKIEKVTKDKALKALLVGVPSLSVNYENRKQIYAESKYDVIIYEKLYAKLGNLLEPDISLNFISAGVGGCGTCNQVQEAVDALRKNGNKTVFGIIDWDSKNTEETYLKVLGQNKRYSIENYIFDPILVSALLIREKIATRVELSLDEKDNYSDFKNFSNEKLQLITDAFFQKIQPEFNPQNNDREIIKYVNGKEIEVPKWYLNFNGHELEEKLKIIFPPLRKFNDEIKFKKEILDKVVDDIPELIPSDILELFKSIQEQ